MKEELEKEYEKLADLEFEYNIISKLAEDKSEKIIAFSKMKRQLEKIRRMESEIQETECDEQKQENG